MEISTNLISGPWAVALVSFIALIYNYLYNLKKDKKRLLEVSNLKSAVNELKKQSDEIQLTRIEAGTANEINAKNVIGLREQIYELKRQTKQFTKSNEVHQKASDTSYLPELFTSDMTYGIHTIIHNGMPLPLAYSPAQTSYESTPEITTMLVIKMLNIGFATAKSIKLRWEFDLEEAITIINKVNENSFFEVSKYNFGTEISIPVAKYRKMYITEAHFREQSISYILPATIDITPIEVPIPSVYLDLYSMHVNSALGFFNSEENELKQTRTTHIDDFPSLILNLQYSDLQNKIHNKKFNLNFNIHELTFPSKGMTNESMLIGTVGIKVNEKALQK